VPGVKLPTVAVVAGGVPVTVVGVWAADPMYGVIVYVVTEPPLLGADQLTVACPVPPVAVTFVT
jgi:hypothetical protein